MVIVCRRSSGRDDGQFRSAGWRLGSLGGCCQLSDLVVGDVGEADPDGFGDAVDVNEGDAGEAVRDQVGLGAAVSGAWAEGEPNVVGFGEPQGSADGEQVAV